MPADKDRKALKLFSASMSIAEIRDELGFRDVKSAENAIRRVLKENQRGKDVDTERQVELDRLDNLYRAAYPRALKGDARMIDKCLSIGEQRMRLLDAPEKRENGLLQAYEKTIDGLGESIGDADTALVQSGRMICAQIDYAVAHGTGVEVTKALYLVPHLMNVLTQLGATPSSRNALAGKARQATSNTASASSSSKIVQMDEFMKRFG